MDIWQNDIIKVDFFQGYLVYIAKRYLMIFGI